MSCFSLLSLCLSGESYSLSSLHFQRFSPSHPLQRHKNDDAADIREHSATLVAFQRHQPSQPPVNFVNSAVSPVLPACHFSGSIAKSAKHLQFVH
jgi:hypothetical protein